MNRCSCNPKREVVSFPGQDPNCPIHGMKSPKAKSTTIHAKFKEPHGQKKDTPTSSDCKCNQRHEGIAGTWVHHPSCPAAKENNHPSDRPDSKDTDLRLFQYSEHHAHFAEGNFFPDDCKFCKEIEPTITATIKEAQVSALKAASDKWWEFDTLPPIEAWEKMKDYLEKRMG